MKRHQPEDAELVPVDASSGTFLVQIKQTSLTVGALIRDPAEGFPYRCYAYLGDLTRNQCVGVFQSGVFCYPTDDAVRRVLECSWARTFVTACTAKPDGRWRL
jgi:hypothetical protein